MKNQDISSGAEKAEKLASPKKKTSDTRTKGKKTTKDKKAEAVKIKAEQRQERLERRLAHKEKVAEQREMRRMRAMQRRSEDKQAKMARIAQEKQAKREERQAKREAQLAKQKARREHALALKAERRARRSQKQHVPGFGGWLAAVISLGVTTMALGTLTVYGVINMGDLRADMATTQAQSLYELNAVVDNLDGNLSKARMATSAETQTKLFSDIAIQSQMAETILERMPLEGSRVGNMASFYNKMSDEAQNVLLGIATGSELTESDLQSLSYMYDTNGEIKKVLNGLTANADATQLLAALDGKEGLFSTSFDELQNNVIQEPKEIYDGPFAENTKKSSAKALTGETITAAEAEEIVQDRFASYAPTDVTCTGEVVAEQLTCYNVSVATEDGEMLVQVAKNGGQVVMFDSYKPCSSANYDVEQCTAIAREMLTRLGFDDMKPVWTSVGGTTCNLNFVHETDGVIYYPDMVKVKVCQERGIVTGIEALAYVLNHTERTTEQAAITATEAEACAHDGMTVHGVRLCLIPHNEGEALAYELIGTNDGQTYYDYIDALTGKEIELFTVIGTAQGRALL